MANEASKILPVVQKFLNNGIGLDLGCGPFKISPRAIGIDAGNYDGVINMRVLDALKCIPNNAVAWIFSSHYLEHESQWREVLQECLRVLQNNGKLLLYLPHCDVYLDGNGRDPNREHVNHWNDVTFREAIADLGFTVDVIEVRNTTPEGHAFTGNGDTEDKRVQDWEYSFYVQLSKPKKG